MRGPLWFVRLSAECSRIRTTCDMMFNAGLERMTSVVGGRRLDEPFPSNIKQFLNWVVGSGALSKGQRKKLPHPREMKRTHKKKIIYLNYLIN